METALFDESGYRFDFSKSQNVCKADSYTYNDLSAVDFVVETEDNILLIEVKNPDNKNATEESRNKFLRELQNNYYPFKAGEKYRSMLLRKWVQLEHYPKPIICIFLLEFAAFAKTERARLKAQLFNRIPFSLNKAEFGGKKHLEQRFELLSFSEFYDMFPDFPLAPVD